MYLWRTTGPPFVRIVSDLYWGWPGIIIEKPPTRDENGESIVAARRLAAEVNESIEIVKTENILIILDLNMMCNLLSNSRPESSTLFTGKPFAPVQTMMAQSRARYYRRQKKF
jgi:hypothetical protein